MEKDNQSYLPRPRGEMVLSLGSLQLLLAILLMFGSTIATNAAGSVGVVTKVLNQAQIGTRAAVAGTPVRMNDELRTGAGARLEVTFIDKSQWTLGENVRLVIDRYVFNPEKSSASIVFDATGGPLRGWPNSRECARRISWSIRLTLRLPCVAPTSGPVPLMGNMACCYSKEA